MTKTLRLLSSLALSGMILASGGNAWSQTLKLGTVDMKKIFDTYYRTKEAEQSINQAKEEARQQLDEKMATYKKEVETTQKLAKEAESTALSQETRQKKMQLFQEKANEVRTMEREIGDFRAQREKQINDQMLRIRNSIVEEIVVLVQDQVKEKSFDLVIDKSGVSMNGVGMVLYARADMDFSDTIIAKLNEKKPAGAATSTPTATPAASPPK